MASVFRIAILLLVLAGADVLASAETSVASPAQESGWVHPIDAPVVDPFRPPANRFSAGNRGLEYGPSDGLVVSAAADGQVVFAGQVGGQLFVTIAHDGNLRSTYAYLASIEVVRGQRLAKAQRLGVAGPGFHLTARLGDRYVDPAALIAGATPGVRLVDGVEPPSRRATLADDGQSLAAAEAAAAELRPSELIRNAASAAEDWYHRECTPVDVALDPVAGERILVTVGGLGSSSGDAAIAGLDSHALGYDEASTVSFSYQGGCTPTPFGAGGEPTGLSAELASSTYGPTDTFVSLHDSAERLAQLLADISAARPGVAVDLAAHSLGGVVTRLAINLLADRGQLGSIDVVMTIGSPHDGAPLANAGFGAADGSLGEFVDAGLTNGGEERLAIATSELSAVDGVGIEPTAAPPGITAVAVAAAGDLVVPALRARWEDATNVLITPTGLDLAATHGALPAAPQVARALELARAGAAPGCRSLVEVLGSTVVGAGVDAAENTVGVVAGLDGWIG